MVKEIVSFEHFDPKIELGVIDASGRPIRPRKKPGRKPNPPSPAQRKAQNRAAQRAFRERKRYEMREAQSTAKKCIHAKNQALHQVKRLQRRVEELEYETNYLKGYVITLRLACEANHVVVPKFWDAGTTDELGVEEMTFSKTKGIPQQLEFFLDKDLHIVGFDQLGTNMDEDCLPSLVFSPTTTYLKDDEEKKEDNVMQEYGTFMPAVLGVTPSLAMSSPIFPPVYLDKNEEETDEKIIDPKTGVIRTVTAWTKEEDGHDFPKEKRIYPPMTLDAAMKLVRSIKHLNENDRVVFRPTELQRTVRHDARIDGIPSPVYRDLMILYQDYYNANELFHFLSEYSVFLGGELGNLDSWFVPPEFFKKYWFLIPSHGRQRMDNAVEVMSFVNKKILELLPKRKAMYLEREQYGDHFPTPTQEEQQEIDLEFLLKDDLQLLNDMMLEVEDDAKSMEEEEENPIGEEIMKDMNSIQPLRLMPSNLPLSQFQQTI